MRMCTNKPKHLCQAHGCKNPPKQKDRLCARHAHIRYKNNNPVAYTYQMIKCNAKRRGHEFTITLEYFEQWAIDNEYMENKGRLATSMSIDRIDPSKGYVPGNLQPLSLSENTIKQHRESDDEVPF